MWNVEKVAMIDWDVTRISRVPLITYTAGVCPKMV